MSSETTKTLVSDIYTDPFLTKEELDELKRTTPPMAWEQEYEVKFLDNALTAFEGVEKSFAIQAGREVRLIVKPDKVSDSEMVIMARDVAKKVEAEMEYPGQIKVNVIRETRAIEYAK